MSKLLFAMALVPFSRNLDGMIVVGHPEHPEFRARFLQLSEGALGTLLEDGQARQISRVQYRAAEDAFSAGNINSFDVDNLEGAGPSGDEGNAGEGDASKAPKAAEKKPAVEKAKPGRKPNAAKDTGAGAGSAGAGAGEGAGEGAGTAAAGEGDGADAANLASDAAPLTGGGNAQGG